jgi:hypothetical protein
VERIIVVDQVMVYIVVMIASNILSQKKRDSIIYENICHYVYKLITNESGEQIKYSARVSIFKGFNSSTANPTLKCVSRYQTRMPYKKTKLTFLPGEGCAGFCYQTQQIVSKTIDEFCEDNPEKYYQESEKELMLKKEKALKANEKSCTLLCVPIKCYEKEKAWGVLVIDSITKTTIFEEYARKVEEIVLNYSTFFSNEE